MAYDGIHELAADLLANPIVPYESLATRLAALEARVYETGEQSQVLAKQILGNCGLEPVPDGSEVYLGVTIPREFIISSPLIDTGEIVVNDTTDELGIPHLFAEVKTRNAVRKTFRPQVETSGWTSHIAAECPDRVLDMVIPSDRIIDVSVILSMGVVGDDAEREVIFAHTVEHVDLYTTKDPQEDIKRYENLLEYREATVGILESLAKQAE